MGVQGWLGTIPPSPAGAVNKSELAGRLFREGRIPDRAWRSQYGRTHAPCGAAMRYGANPLSYDWRKNAVDSYYLAIATLRERYLESRLPGESAREWLERTYMNE